MELVIAWLAKHWRLVVYAIAAIAALWLLGLVVHWKHNSDELAAVQAELKGELECSPKSACRKRADELAARNAAIAAQVVKEYQDEIAALNARPIPRRVIRVCPSASDVRISPAAGGAGQGTGAAPGLDRPDEFDTGPLRVYARDAAALAAQCRSIIRRDQALATVPK